MELASVRRVGHVAAARGTRQWRWRDRVHVAGSAIHNGEMLFLRNFFKLETGITFDRNVHLRHNMLKYSKSNKEFSRKGFDQLIFPKKRL